MQLETGGLDPNDLRECKKMTGRCASKGLKGRRMHHSSDSRLDHVPQAEPRMVSGGYSTVASSFPSDFSRGWTIDCPAIPGTSRQLRQNRRIPKSHLEKTSMNRPMQRQNSGDTPRKRKTKPPQRVHFSEKSLGFAQVAVGTEPNDPLTGPEGAFGGWRRAPKPCRRCRRWARCAGLRAWPSGCS